MSDFSPLAGLPTGTYGPWSVDPSGKIVVAGTPYLAGSNQGIETGLNHLRSATGWDLSGLIDTVTINPARLLGQPAPRLAPGTEASFVLLEIDEQEISLKRTCVRGRWQEPVAS